MIDEQEAYLLACGLIDNSLDDDERAAAIAYVLQSEVADVRAVAERRQAPRT